MIFTDAGGGAAAHDGAVHTRDRHLQDREQLAGPLPVSPRKEPTMTTLKLTRRYLRYVASSLAAVAFKLTAN